MNILWQGPERCESSHMFTWNHVKIVFFRSDFSGLSGEYWTVALTAPSSTNCSCQALILCQGMHFGSIHLQYSQGIQGIGLCMHLVLKSFVIDPFRDGNLDLYIWSLWNSFTFGLVQCLCVALSSSCISFEGRASSVNLQLHMEVAENQSHCGSCRQDFRPGQSTCDRNFQLEDH